MDEPADGRVYRHLPLIFTAVIGVAITLAAFLVFLGQENTRLRSDFQSLAGDRAQASSGSMPPRSRSCALRSSTPWRAAS